MTEALLIVAALALVLCCAVFVAAEFAFVTVDRASVERAAEGDDRSAGGVLAALRSLSTQLSGAQVGITVTNLMIGFLAEPAIADIVDGPLIAAGVPESIVPGIALVIALTIATTVTMILGELVPKNLAISRPLQTARAVQRPMRLFTAIARPVIAGCNGTANAILRRIGVEPQEELASARSADELASLVRRSGDEGTLESETAALLQRSLAFGERTAADVMTPRPRMRTLDAGEPVLAVIEQARASGFSRFPVTDGDDSAVVGVVHVKQVVGVPADRRGETPVREVMAPPLAVPSTILLDPLMRTLRRGGLQMAIVVDEFGDVDGLVTLEDIVEEIVGEVTDEHDRPDPRARRLADGGWLLSGLLRPDEASRIAGVQLPEGRDTETIAGLVTERLERMPAPGDVAVLEARDAERRPVRVRLAVRRMDGLRIDRIALHAEPDPERGDDDE